MKGHDYEYEIARYLKNHGYTGVTVTKGSGDFGVDVIANKGGHRYAVQCKYYSNPVGLSAVQEAVAGMAFYKCDRAMVVTNSTFTKAARELAAANHVVLLDGIRSGGVGASRLSLCVKIVLVGAYIFVASAMFAAMLDVVKGQPFWKAAYNVVTSTAFITFPLWIVPAIRGIKHLIKRGFERHREEKKPEATPVQQTQIPSAQARIAVVDEQQVRSALMRLSGEYYSADISGITSEAQISTSTIQRRLKVGINRANAILDVLQDQGLITFVALNRYVWTEKALLHDAEGPR